MQDKLLRTDQVQRRLNCSRSMVCKLLREGKLRGLRLGNAWRVHESSVNSYIEKQSEFFDTSCTACTG